MAFNRADMSNTLFFVYIKCKGTPGECTPCRLDEETKKLYRQGMSAFGGISPTYHISLAENAPVIVWNFHSLLVMIQMCFSFMLTDSDCDMKLCKHCGRAFIASRKGNEFCSPKCKNQYNVYKTRAKKNKTDE